MELVVTLIAEHGIEPAPAPAKIRSLPVPPR
jgi:hypothetical protein